MDMGMPAPEQQDPDQSLFEALSQTDAGSMVQIMQRHERWVRGVVFGVLGRADSVDDVMQEIWLTVWRRASTLQDSSRWRFWLYAIARNTAVDAGRKVTRQRSMWKRLTQQLSHSAGYDGHVHHRLAGKEQHERVLSAIRGLPEIYREPFVLRHLEDWSYRQIAQTMGLPVATVETRLVRARRLLRQVLGDDQ
jgi:RNA polymerase sigma-70 factor (ECF subfamily)